MPASQYTIGDAPGAAPPSPSAASPYTIGDAPGAQLPAAAAAQPAVPPDLEYNDPQHPEGTYSFMGPGNRVYEVPYSKALELLGHPEGALGSGQAEVDRYRTAAEDTRSRGFNISQEDYQRLYNDYAHDPQFKAVRWQNFKNSLPPLQYGIGFLRSAAKKVIGAHDIVAGKPQIGLTDLAEGKTQPTPGTMREFAQEPNANIFQKGGGVGENVVEFESGMRLLGLLGKSIEAGEAIDKGSTLGKLLLSAVKQGGIAGTQKYLETGGDKLEAAESAGITGGLGLLIPGVSATWQAGKAMVRGPAEAAAETASSALTRQETAVANAAKINQAAQAERDAAAAAAASRQQRAATNAASINQAAQAERDAAAAAAVQARQQGATANAARINQAAQAERDAAAASAATRQEAATRNAEAINKAAQAERDAAAAAAAARPGTAEYAQQAQEAARPVLEQGGVSREVTMAQPGGAPPAATGQRVAIATGRNVENTIAKMQDFTGAADRLEEHGQPIYDDFERVTDGRFRKLNAEVQSAKQAMYDGEKGADELYQQKQQQMNALMDSTQGAITPERLAAGKALWTKQYALRDVGDLLDKNINRVQGSTEPAGAGADINGNGMLKGLQRLVTRYKGRARVDEILGGPGRLDTLEGIAQANTTDAKKQAFQQAFTTVQEQLELLAKAEAAAAKARGPQFKYEFTTPEAEHQKLLDAENAAAQKAASKQGFKYEFTTPEAEHDKLLKAERAAERAAKGPKFQYEFTTPEAEHQKLLDAEGKGAKPSGESRKLLHSVGRGAAQLAGAAASRVAGGSWFEGIVAGGAMYDSSRLVMKALVTNPKIANNFLFALQSGATPARYGPLIARMVAQHAALAEEETKKPEQPQETQP